MPGKYIVVVDDEFDVQEILRYNLKKEGFQVDTFSNPVTAIEHVAHNKPNLILTDWLMPEMDGLEFCKVIKSNQDTIDIPVVMITCKGDESDISSALAMGAEDYFVKPFRISDLIIRIRKILQDEAGKKLD